MYGKSTHLNAKTNSPSKQPLIHIAQGLAVRLLLFPRD